MENIEEIEDKKKFGDDEVVIYLVVRSESSDWTQSNTHPNWSRLKSAKLE